MFFLGCQAGETAYLEHGKISAEDLERARQQMSSGAGGYRAAGARLSETYMLAQLAELHLRAAKLADAGRLLDEAETVLESGTERYWEAELSRLRGELLAAQGRHDPAEKPLRRALALARERGDRAFELRAALSLGRWLEAAGRGEEAGQMVNEAADAYGEESGEADLADARGFLSRLTV